jgi:hypothetical protein
MKWCKLARGVRAKFLKQTDLKQCLGVLLFTLNSRWRPTSFLPYDQLEVSPFGGLLEKYRTILCYR